MSGRTYFHSATVVIPSSWTPAQCGQHVGYPTSDTPYRLAHFVIESAGTESEPSAQQSAGCGEPGDFLSIPSAFLTSENITDKATDKFVSQWFKYRYGVFDELGFSSDNSSSIKDRVTEQNKIQEADMFKDLESDKADSEYKENKTIACSLGLNESFQSQVNENTSSCDKVRELLSPSKQASRPASAVIIPVSSTTG